MYVTARVISHAYGPKGRNNDDTKQNNAIKLQHLPSYIVQRTGYMYSLSTWEDYKEEYTTRHF